MCSTRPSQQARLFFLIGASGAGKDTLINYCRPRLQPHHRVLVAHRYITRAAASGGENHVEVSAPEFAQRRDAGLFALDWTANDVHYGIGIEIDDWLKIGFHVLVNGSRAHLEAAQNRYGPRLYPILVRASVHTQRVRLAERGREDPAHINTRLYRSRRLEVRDMDSAHIIENDGAVPDAGERLLAILRRDVCASTSQTNQSG